MDVSLVIDLIITTIVAGRQTEITVQTYKHKDDFNRQPIVNVCNALNGSFECTNLCELHNGKTEFINRNGLYCLPSIVY